MKYAKNKLSQMPIHHILGVEESQFLINKLAQANTSREHRQELMKQARERLKLLKISDLKVWNNQNES